MLSNAGAGLLHIAADILTVLRGGLERMTFQQRARDMVKGVTIELEPYYH